MKLKTKFATIILAISSALFISTSTASAGECSASDPCLTYAMLDSSGVVINIIVCQPSVCGGGTWAGQTVGPQVAPNPVTHHADGIGSYIGNPDQTTQVKYSEGTFVITENTIVTKTDTEINDNSLTTTQVRIPISERTFTYEDTINKPYGQVEMITTKFNENVETVLEVTQATFPNIEENILYSVIQESIGFNQRKTENEIIETINNNGLNLLLSKVQTLISLLGTWVK